MQGNRVPPRGDEADLFCRHNAELVQLLILRLGATREQAEDAAQIAWALFYREQPERTNVIGWLYVTARYRIYDARRLGKRQRAVARVPEHPTGASLAGEVEARETLRLLAGLKPQQRQVLQLIAAGCSYQEICELTGHTYTNVISGRACRDRGVERCSGWRHVADGVRLPCRLWARRRSGVVVCGLLRRVLARPSVGRAGPASTPSGFPRLRRVTPAPVRGR